MHSTNRLGVIAVLTTLIVVFAVFGAYQAVQSIFFADKKSNNQEVISNSNEINPQDEWDPLINNLYRNDSEFEEVEKEIPPLTQEEVDAIKQELNVPSPDTYTGRYLSQLPEELPRADVLNPGRITSFVNENKGNILPEISRDSVSITNDSSAESISNYLKSISPLHNPDLKHITSSDIELAYANSYTTEGKTVMNAIIQDLNNNLDIIQKVPVPAEIVDLHLKLISASTALLDSVNLLNNTSKDFVGGLIAAKRIEELGNVFSELDQEIKAVEDKYKL